MKSFPLIITTLTVIISCFGCSSTPEDEPTSGIQHSRIHELISDFYNTIHPETKAGATNFSITDISTTTYNISHPTTRTDTSETESQYDIHTVSLDFGESSGYAVVSDTPGLDRIFYYTESGAMQDTIEIVPLRELIQSIPMVAERILDNTIYDSSLSTRAGDITIQPIVPYQWGQRQPFNNYATYCTCAICSKYGNHMPIGCVTIALGQTIATVGKFTGTFYGTRDINFSLLPEKGSLFTPTQALTVAHFLQEIALNCQIKFGCGGSGTSVEAAVNYLKDLKYTPEYVKGGINDDRFIRNLQKGYPHLIAGRSSSEGHMWLLDGYIRHNNKSQYHINWGWGPYQSNGWSDGCCYCDYKEPYPSYSSDLRQIYLN
ncbi:MAG: C10 family peptidase [Muribaculaceae bacterium]|nr:C10 family peptidase [Muribaculaceae bacterium]